MTTHTPPLPSSPTPDWKTFWWSAGCIFAITFNLGYVFHDLALGAWFHTHVPFSRDHYIIPYIALAFVGYAIIFAHLFPMYLRSRPQHGLWRNGLTFGWIMGFLFDALQGGIIEVATFEMPLIVFAVDSSYHVFVEGSIAGLIAAAVHSRLHPNTATRLALA